MQSQRGFGYRTILAGLGLLILVVVAGLMWRGQTPQEPAGGTEGAGSIEDDEPVVRDTEAPAGGAKSEPLYRSSLLAGGGVLGDMLTGPHRDEALSMLLTVLKVSRERVALSTLPIGPAVLPGLLTGGERDLTQMSPFLLSILDETWNSETRSKSQVESAQSIVQILVSELDAPQVEFSADRPETNREALERLASWFEGLMQQDASFEAMLTGGGHPRLTMGGPGLIGVTPPTDIELSDSIARAEFGDGLHVEALEVVHGGKAALLRGASREGELWSVLLTDAGGEPYRLYQFHDMKVEDLGAFGWRIRAHVAGDALHAYLTPEGAFRFYHARFQGTGQEAQGRHLLSLATQGDVEELKRLLDAGADPETKGEQSTTLLHLAAAHGQVAVAELLIERGALIDAQAETGVTALQFAAYAAPRPPWESKRPAKGTEHVAVARLLLKHGARVDVGRDNQWGWGTPLHLAAFAGHVPMARFLIENGADVNAVETHFRNTPLHQAAKNGIVEPGMRGWSREGDHVGVVRLLLEHGANPEARDCLGGTPLQQAVGYGAQDIVDLLLKAGADVSQKGGLGSALMQACGEGNVALMERLIKEGASITERNPHGLTVLHRAALGGHVDAVRFLLDRECDLNARTKSGDTPLHHAANMGHIEVLALLVKHGGDLQAVNKAGASLLHAAAGGCLATRETLEFLLTRGLDIHAQTHAGKTPLALAREARCLMGSSIPDYLRELGAKR